MSHCNENEINPSRPSFFCFTGFFFRHIFSHIFSHLFCYFMLFLTLVMVLIIFSNKSILRISRILSIFRVPLRYSVLQFSWYFHCTFSTFLPLVLFSLVSLSYSMPAFSANSLGLFSFKISSLHYRSTILST